MAIPSNPAPRATIRARRRAVPVVLLAGLLFACHPLGAPSYPPLRVPLPPISEIRLENGLRIFVVERHSAPTFAAVYRFDVGSADDPRGRSGTAHLLEHMMFTGSRELGAFDPQREGLLAGRLDALWQTLDAEREQARRVSIPADSGRTKLLRQQIAAATAEYRGLVATGEYDTLVDRIGGVGRNASTGHDSTTYQVQLPANRLELWFRLESDRLKQPMFRDFYTERDVVREERRRRYESQPDSMMRERLLSLLFSAHPYGTPVIGWPDDIEHLHREDALAYFRSHYTPAHCSMVLVGDLRAAEVEQLARRYLGSWQPPPSESQRAEDAPRHTTREPEQHGERRQVIEHDAAPRIWLGWATVAEGHPDHLPLKVLASILGGMSRSRLSRSLGGGSAGHSALATAGYFTVGARSGEWRWLARWQESRLEKAIREIQESGVTAVELARAKHNLQNDFLPGLSSDLPLAIDIAWVAMSSPGLRYLAEYPELIAKVTAEQVRSVAKRYLRPERKCVVELRRPAHKKTRALAAQDSVVSPEEPLGSAAQEPSATPDLPTPGRHVEPAPRQAQAGQGQGSQHSAAFTQLLTELSSAPPLRPHGPELGKEVDRVVLPSGITLFLQEDHSRPTVSLQLSWRGGVNTAPLRDLDAWQLASGLLNSSGTTRLSAEEVSERKRELGMSFHVSLGETLSQAGLFAPTQSFLPAYELAMDVLMHPRIGEWRTWQSKFQFVNSMQSRGESLASGAGYVLADILDGDHPRLGYVPSKWRFLLTTWPYQIRRLWRRYLGRDNLYIAAVGDFDKRALIGLIESTLGRWRPSEDSRRQWLARPPHLRPGAFLVRKSFTGATVALAHQLPIDRTAPESDHAALDVLEAILSGNGLQSRLARRLRVEEGLTYDVTSIISHQGHPGVPGLFRVNYQTRSGQIFRSLTCALEEIERLRREEVPAALVEEQLDVWRNKQAFHYASPVANVSRLMSYELDDRPPDYDRRSMEARERVTPADILRVAQKYLRPEQLTVALFGSLTTSEENQIRARFGLKVLPWKEVFRGGY